LTLWTTFLLVDATLIGLFAAVAFVVSRAPGWKEVRPYAWGALAALVYCSCDAANANGAGEASALWLARLSMAAAGCFLASWFGFTAGVEARRVLRYERMLQLALIIGGTLCLVPALADDGKVTHHLVPFLGVTVSDVMPAPFEASIDVLFLAVTLHLFVHYERQRRKGLAHARTYLLVLSVSFVTGLNDALVSGGFYRGPYLIGAGLMFMVLGVGYVMARRFLSYASSLHVLSAQLERTVEQRGKELAEANQALTRAEKLAAVGQLAAGVAHEINNPAAVIKGNLTFLKEELTGKVDDEVAVCLDDSISAVGRIARIVRELLSAGRVAGRAEAKLEAFSVKEAIEAALTVSEPALSGVKAEVADRSDRALLAVGQSDLVTQVVANLVTNAVQAIAGSGVGGKVEISTERRSDGAVVAVEDDGPGIPEALQAKVFEPFFTTKEVGKGTGLGLAVSIGLMQAQGGNLTLRHSKKGSTRFELVLPMANVRPGEIAGATEEAAPKLRALRLLLVDDDAAVLSALNRTLKMRHQVTTATGVVAAMALIDGGAAYDAVLCDVAMPDGGGEGIYATLNQSHPKLAARTFFITGGALEPRSREFIEQHRDRVLLKPFDSKQLFRLLEALEPPAPIQLPVPSAAAEGSSLKARAG
jgi:signal transduction histidine kinase/ActR/RegA family two-component response regulator